MQTSERGRLALEQEEGTPLRAYRDLVGKWTIYAGLTAASGVVTPKAGMVITRDEGEHLLSEALRLNYEPAVSKSMSAGQPTQHAFDAGVLFHWNTGAIGRASWVRHWRTRVWPATETSFKAWNKAGGKVVKGLVNRRAREFEILRHGRYPMVGVRGQSSPTSAQYAGLVAPVVAADLTTLRSQLAHLDYAVGDEADRILRDAVVKFQADHALTPDGVIGRATATTLQRVINARAKAKPAAAMTVVTGTGAGSGADEMLFGIPGTGAAAALASGLYGLWLGWHYRDAVAAAVQRPLPRLAAFLRRF